MEYGGGEYGGEYGRRVWREYGTPILLLEYGIEYGTPTLLDESIRYGGVWGVWEGEYGREYGTPTL